jgi:translation initiation factor IF-3
MQHQQEGRRVLDQVLEKLADAGKVERPPSMEGRKMTVLLMPIKAPAKAPARSRTARSQPPDRAATPATGSSPPTGEA